MKLFQKADPADSVATARRVSKAKQFMVGSALAMVAGVSMAQTGPDVSAATEGLGAVKTAVEQVGPLMLSAVGAGIVFKWVLAFLI